MVLLSPSETDQEQVHYSHVIQHINKRIFFFLVQSELGDILLWRAIHAIVILWMVRHLTSVVAILAHTTASLGTTVLEWLFMANMLETGQWFDAIATAALLYKMALILNFTTNLNVLVYE